MYIKTFFIFKYTFSLIGLRQPEILYSCPSAPHFIFPGPGNIIVLIRTMIKGLVQPFAFSV